MQEIIIDEEFRFLLPALDEETFSCLKKIFLNMGAYCTSKTLENTSVFKGFIASH